MTSGGPGTPVRMGVLALLWGSGFLWIKIALNHGLSPLQITAARCALGAAVLFTLAWTSGRRLPRGRRTWSRLVVAALLCNVVPFFLFSVGERTVDSSTAGVLNATTPLWALLIGIGLGTERGLSRIRLGGLLLGFAGTVLIFAPWRQSGLLDWGALALLGAAVSYAAAFAYMGRALAGKGTEPVALAAAQLITASGLSGVALPVAGGLVPVRADATALMAVVVLGVFGTGVTFYLNYRLIADEGATNAATVGYLLPPVSVVLGALVLDEEIGLRVIVGMVTVLAGVAVTHRTGRAAREQLPADPPPQECAPPVRTGSAAG